MKKLIFIFVITLVSGIAMADTPELNISNQVPQNDVITINHVDLSQPGYVTLSAANRYGGLMQSFVIGRTYVTAGTHDDVEIHLDPNRLRKFGYMPGIEQKAFVTVSDGKYSKSQPLYILIPDPADDVS